MKIFFEIIFMDINKISIHINNRRKYISFSEKLLHNQHKN